MDRIVYLYAAKENRIVIKCGEEKDFSLVWVQIPDSLLEKIMFPEWESYLQKKTKQAEKQFIERETDRKKAQKGLFKKFAQIFHLKEQVFLKRNFCSTKEFAPKKENGTVEYLQNVRQQGMLSEKQEKKLYKEWESMELLGRNAVKELFFSIKPFLTEEGENYCVYGEGCGKLLKAEVWKDWSVPEFENYLEAFWTHKLMEYASSSHFIVLGYVPYLCEFLCQYVSRMKSLCLVLPEDKYDFQMQDFLEEFYEEHGLAASVQFVKDSFRSIRFRKEESVSILDFTEEYRVPFLEVAEGSVWLDMASDNEKERYILARGMKITYFSLKRKWKPHYSSDL